MSLRHRMGAAAAALALGTAAFSAAVVAAAPVGAVTTTFTVTNTADSGADSLRDVLENQVSNGDVVELTAGATYKLTDCEAGDIEIDAEVTINGNGATIQQTCSNGIEDGVLYTVSDLTVNFVTITGGVAVEGGGAIYQESGDLIVYGSTITGNFACNNGGGIHVHEDTLIAYSTITGNTTTDDGGAIANDDDGAIRVFNSTITGNTGGEVGGIENDDNDTYLVYTTLVDNTTDPTVECPIESAPEGARSAHAHTEVSPQDSTYPANIRVEDTSRLHTFGSVIAKPHGGTNCGDFEDEPLTNTVSEGYNFSDDTSCNLTGTGDSQVPAANPVLGALGANGGPTATMLPGTGSPLIDAIPLAACSPASVGTAVKDDQRFLQRPDALNQKCDIGAVEVQTTAAEIAPNFTG